MGYSNAQIADAMFLSPESVKKYLYDIFQALEVKSRMKAVIKAKEIGVIEWQERLTEVEITRLPNILIPRKALQNYFQIH